MEDFTANEWLEYTVYITATGVYTFALRVNHADAGEAVHLELNHTDISGEMALSDGNGAWTDYTSRAVQIDQGVYVLRIHADSGTFSLNYFDVQKVH
ncbi:MAG: carbohydrate-binding protein [Myxococcota bacterium]|nr:carbohydrate-binding protein [Myxococcota bacterium]